MVSISYRKETVGQNRLNFTYIAHVLVSLLFRVVKINRSLLVRRVFQIGPEQSQVLVLLLLVLRLLVVKMSLLFGDSRLDDGFVLEFEIVEDTFGNLIAKVLQSFGTHSQLTDAVDFECV